MNGIQKNEALKPNTSRDKKLNKLTNWENEPDLAIFKNDLLQATSANKEQVAKVEHWQDLLNIENTAKLRKQEGRSSVQPKVIRKQAEWRYSALSEPFLSSPDVFTVNPKTWLDVDAAKQNELVLNYQFNNQINKVQFIDNLVRAVVNDGTAIVRISWDYEESVTAKTVPVYQYAEASDNPTLAQQIIQASQMFQQQDPQFAQLPHDIQESAKATIENQRPIVAIHQDDQEQDVLSVERNQPKVDLCDIRNVYIDPTCNGVFENANFVIYAFESCLSELRKYGIYSNLDDIKVDESHGDNYTSLRDDYSFQYQDKPRKKFVVYEYWGYYDIDDSGITTPIVATWVGDVLIRLERNPYPDNKIPFVVIPYLPVKNSIYGEPDAVLLEENQKLFGALTRGMVDAMAKSANAQTGIRKDALDAVNKRKFKQGLDYEFNPNIDPRAAIIDHTYPELPQSTYAMLQHLAQEAEAMTGVKSFNNGISGDSYAGQTAAGVQGTLTATSKRESAILRRLSKGIEFIAGKILAMNSVWLSDEEVIRITDESFVAINRSNLSGTFDIKLDINTPENNAAKAQQLSFMLQTMAQTLPLDLTKIVLAEIAHLQNMPQLSNTLLKYNPPPDPMQQIQMQKAQVDLQMAQAHLQAVPVETQLKQSHIQKSVAQAHELEAQAQLLQVQTKDLSSGIAHQRELEIQNAQTQGHIKRDIAKGVVGHKMRELGNTNE